VGNLEEKKSEEKQNTEKSPEKLKVIVKQEKKTEEKQDTEKSSEKLEATAFAERVTEKRFENLDTTTKQEKKTDEKQDKSSEKQEIEATQEPAEKEDNAGLTRRYTIAHGTFVMEILASDGIWATALARQIHQSPITFTQSVTSIVTDDFVTARGVDSHLLDSAVDCNDDDIADHEQKYFSHSYDGGLTSSVFDGNTDTKTTMHVDPAEKAYDAAKGVWAWGKGAFAVKHFLGIAEAVAGKAVGMAGSTLEDLDHAIMPRLQKWDDSILNPALQAMVGTILGAVKKSEDIFKPVVFAILKPIGLIKEDDKKSSEP
jgi:hypothetical protein